MRHIIFLTLGFLITGSLSGQGSIDTVHAATDTTVENTYTGKPIVSPIDTMLTVVDTIKIRHDSSIMKTDSIQPQKDAPNNQPVVLSVDSAAMYITNILGHEQYWRPGGTVMKQSLQHLIRQYYVPYDSTEQRLSVFPYDSILIGETELVKNDTLPLKWLNDSTFIIDTTLLKKEPLITIQTVWKRLADTTRILIRETRTFQNVPNDTADMKQDTLPHAIVDTSLVSDTVVETGKLHLLRQDTLMEVFIDSASLDAKNIQLYGFRNNMVIPPLIQEEEKAYSLTPDRSKVVFYDTLKVLTADKGSPFYIVNNRRMPDSLKSAVLTLTGHIYKRDSVMLNITDMYGHKTPFWLSADNDELYRFWIKNYKNDSITVWLGNPEKYDLSLFLEEEVLINRPEKQPTQEIPIPRTEPESFLLKVDPLEVIPVYWDFEFSSLLAFNQTYLSNWSKGGESSVATMVDLKGGAQYNNTRSDTKWITNGRLKYGSLITEEYGIRTNTDQFEINSQYNKVISKKVDFSTVFYMKNQIARGYNYPNDSVVVSKFLNPGTFTVGVGAEYKPFKKTVFNFSPLSYKNTFVLDTTIDQTVHGIEENKMVRQELGGQLVATNSITLLEGLDMSNSVRLFANYFDQLQNVDVDWELNLEKRINWYFTISFNLHIIYDNDIRFPVLDDAGEQVLLDDGSPLKEPKMQLKEFVGLNFSFKF
ncbi:MAG: DUF3078 domain-containing protein [Bacteroidales bacterium]|nr:DUF3078 domain-containing protein [Bacteroidales bacterium]